MLSSLTLLQGLGSASQRREGVWVHVAVSRTEAVGLSHVGIIGVWEAARKALISV